MVDISCAQKDIGYQFQDEAIIREALTAARVAVSSDENKLDESNYGNKRLTVVGNALNRLVAMDKWFPLGSSPGMQHPDRINTPFDQHCSRPTENLWRDRNESRTKCTRPREGDGGLDHQNPCQGGNVHDQRQILQTLDRSG